MYIMVIKNSSDSLSPFKTTTLAGKLIEIKQKGF